MNFGEKFPYALLTFSQKFVEAGYWVHYTSIITRTPSSTSTPTPHTPYTHTNYTPTIH